MSLPLSTEITLPSGVKYEQPLGLFINNEFVKSIAGNTLSSVNPTTEKVIAEVYAAEAEDVDVAVAVAKKTFKSVWKRIGGDVRAALLRKLALLMDEHKETLAAIEAADSGKPLHTNALGDVEEGINVINYCSGWADKVGGKTIEAGPNKFAYTLHEPHGVCGQIIPWNYPLLMAIWKIGPAIAAGNVLVLKTAEQTPLSMLYFGKLVVEAGFPPGVINIISGFGKTAGAALASHLDVDKIAFTGSTATGKIIMKLASSNLKNITLECGGKSPLIIFDDADFDQAVKWAHAGIMSNQGQVCSATSRIFVQDTIYDKFNAALKEHTKKTSVIGDPYTEDVIHGPQVTDVQQKRVLSYIAKGKEEGAKLILGGKAPEGKGFYIEPTIFTDVEDEMTIMKEEIFGPVVAITKFSTEEEAISRANNTSYGLGSAVFTTDITKAHRVAGEIEAGMVWINSSNDSDYRIPFGGFKSSGIGSELGEYGITTYTKVKAIHVNLGTKL